MVKATQEGTFYIPPNVGPDSITASSEAPYFSDRPSPGALVTQKDP
jgi:hypothetical protein